MQKVFKNGNSLAVTVPKVYAQELSIQKGSIVEWKKTNQGLVLLANKKGKFGYSVNPKFVKMVDEFISEHEDVLKELSNR